MNTNDIVDKILLMSSTLVEVNAAYNNAFVGPSNMKQENYMIDSADQQMYIQMMSNKKLMIVYDYNMILSVGDDGTSEYPINVISPRRIRLCKDIIRGSYLDGTEYINFEYPSTEEELECKLFQMSTTSIHENTLDNFKIGWYIQNKKFSSTSLRVYEWKKYMLFYDNIIDSLNNILVQIKLGTYYNAK